MILARREEMATLLSLEAPSNNIIIRICYHDDDDDDNKGDDDDEESPQHYGTSRIRGVRATGIDAIDDLKNSRSAHDHDHDRHDIDDENEGHGSDGHDCLNDL